MIQRLAYFYVLRGSVGDMFDKDKVRKATTITDMYAALDLGQRTVRAVLKRQDGKIVKELKIKKQADSVLKFLKRYKC